MLCVLNLRKLGAPQNVLVRRIAAVEGAELITDDPETASVTIPTVSSCSHVFKHFVISTCWQVNC
jgi:hypothetical protein